MDDVNNEVSKPRIFRNNPPKLDAAEMRFLSDVSCYCTLKSKKKGQKNKKLMKKSLRIGTCEILKCLTELMQIIK
jgi:hypothetical protein